MALGDGSEADLPVRRGLSVAEHDESFLLIRTIMA
jgi:hypothetical protein